MGHGKYSLKRLSADCFCITANGLVDAMRLVEQSSSSHLERLVMHNNNGMLDNNQDVVKLLCNKLEKNKVLCWLDLNYCNASEDTANDMTTMLVDMLRVNTTLKFLIVNQHYPLR
jgi:hypothetical protein